jgi:integrase
MAGHLEKRNGKIRARYREPDGTERSRTFASRAHAKAFLDRVGGELAAGTYVSPAGIVTFAEFAVPWLAMQPWAEGTRARAESLYRIHIEPEFGRAKLAHIRRSHIQAWCGQLELAPASVEGALGLLRQILRAAVHDRLIAHSPADGVRLPRQDKVTAAPLTVAEVEAIAGRIRPELRRAVLFAAMSGVRQGELFGISNDRVDWLGRRVTIDRQMVTLNGGPRFGPTKTRKARVVPLTEAGVELLAGQVAEFGLGDDGLIFHRSPGPWRRQRAGEAMTAAGGDGWHRLRHHCASVLIFQGVNVTGVAAMLGHSPAECLSTYAAWWPSEDDTLRDAVKRAWNADQPPAVKPGASTGG